MATQEAVERFIFVLGEIARGRCDNGRPLAAEIARQMARDVLSYYGERWPEKTKKQSDVGLPTAEDVRGILSETSGMREQ